MTPRPVQHGGGVELAIVLGEPEPPSVLRVRADCGGRLFPVKFAVAVHYLAHQLLDHLLPDHAILTARQFSDRLGDRVNYFICFSGRTRCRAILFQRVCRRHLYIGASV